MLGPQIRNQDRDKIVLNSGVETRVLGVHVDRNSSQKLEHQRGIEVGRRDAICDPLESSLDKIGKQFGFLFCRK